MHDKQPSKKYRKIRIGKKIYKFVYHRLLNGQIKTVIIKRDSAGRLWVCFSVIEEMDIPKPISTGKISGFDFGLTHFLTSDTGHTIHAPPFFVSDLPKLRKVQRQVSRKVVGSHNHRKAQKHIARSHIRISDRRRVFHFQLAHALCDEYDVMVFEDLNLDAMKRLWGRKVSDLSFGQFITILKWFAFKRGKRVLFIDRFEPTTKKCSACGHQQKMELKDRVFRCGNCGIELDRDHNTALNILAAGHRCLLHEMRKTTFG